MTDCRESYGFGKYVNFLRGSKTTPEWCQDKPNFGKGLHRSLNWSTPALVPHTRFGGYNPVWDDRSDFTQSRISQLRQGPSPLSQLVSTPLANEKSFVQVMRTLCEG